MRVTSFGAMLILVVAGVLRAQTVSGIVREQVTERPLRQIAVELADSSVAVRSVTDAQGTFTLTTPRPGTYALWIGQGPEQLLAGAFVVSADSFVQRAFLVPERRVYGAREVTDSVTQVRGIGRLEYPPELRAANVQGAVLAQVVIDTLGRPRAETIRAVLSDNPAFLREAGRCILTMRFRPAMRDGVKVEQAIKIPFTFTLKP